LQLLYKISLLIVSAYLLTSCRTVKIQEYFRTYDLENLIYKFKRDSSGFTTFYDDTLTCRIIVRNKIFSKNPDQNFDVFYFDKSNLSMSPEWESPFFGFSYCFNRRNLYAEQYFDKSPGRMSGNGMKLLIPSRIRIGDSFMYQGSDYKGKLTFIEFEDLQWHHFELHKCLKFSYEEVFSKSTYYIWFTKKWGIIKWTKPNGDEGTLYE
jgi:hypothetical protein